VLDLGAVTEEARARRRDLDNLTVVGKNRATSLREERGDVRREEVLALAEADDERRLVADADEQVRMLRTARLGNGTRQAAASSTTSEE